MAVITPIGYIKSDFPTKFGIPRQSGVVKELKATVVFEKEFANKDFIRGLEGFSHIWLLWGFSESNKEGCSPTVRPPKLGGNTRVGVFATRSPYRPNPIGMSCVEIESIELDTPKGSIIHVLGADLLNGTPIYDIKPYISISDAHLNAKNGFIDQIDNTLLDVQIDEKHLVSIDKEDIDVISKLLAQDPRPAYQDDEKRIYGMEYKKYEIKFSVKGNKINVTKIKKYN